MRRVKVNMTLDAEVAETARALGLNMSRLAEATKAERNRLWRAESRAANAANAEELAREGLPFAAFRTF
jgi:antitoxin CcdA